MLLQGKTIKIWEKIMKNFSINNTLTHSGWIYIIIRRKNIF